MTFKLARRYQLQPDRARCHHPGCSWNETGPDAEQYAALHVAIHGHEVRVATGATVILTRPKRVTLDA